jgi:hypothetical protein
LRLWCCLRRKLCGWLWHNRWLRLGFGFWLSLSLWLWLRLWLRLRLWFGFWLRLWFWNNLDNGLDNRRFDNLYGRFDDRFELLFYIGRFDCFDRLLLRSILVFLFAPEKETH